MAKVKRFPVQAICVTADDNSTESGQRGSFDPTSLQQAPTSWNMDVGFFKLFLLLSLVWRWMVMLQLSGFHCTVMLPCATMQIAFSGDAGYLTILTGKDFTSGRGSADVEMRSVGFDLHLGTNDKYRLCNKSFPCDYSRFLQARGHFTEYCHSIGLHGRGHSCNSTPVCDNHDDEECGFRCEIPSAPGVVGVDEWTRQSAQDLLDQHWRGSGRPFFVQAPRQAHDGMLSSI